MGSADDSRSLDRILDAGIEAVIQLAAEEPPMHLPRETIFVRIPLLDGAENSPDLLRLAVNTVKHLLTNKVRTFVACSAGMSRSPAIAAFAIAESEDRSPIESLTEIGKYRRTDVSLALWKSLLECAG